MMGEDVADLVSTYTCQSLFFYLSHVFHVKRESLNACLKISPKSISGCEGIVCS